jgi:hypothetical protein
VLKIYLAAAWHRKAEIAGIADELNLIPGIRVQSRWLTEQGNIGGLSAHGRMKFLRSRALIDVADVRECDILVRFSDDLSMGTVPAALATGSRMVEMGIALADGKPVIVVGGHQPVFDYLPNVIHVRDVAELKSYLEEN